MRYLARRAGTTEPGQPPDPSRPIGADLLPQIEHIVVLMMENHSYDNYLGMLRGRGEGFPLGVDGEPVCRTRTPVAGRCPRTTCPPRSSTRKCPRRAGTRATCS